MVVDVVTLFPGMFFGPFQDSILARSRRKGRVGVRIHDLRRWGTGPHRLVDDNPYGGGGGMILRPEPLFEAVDWVELNRDAGAGADWVEYRTFQPGEVLRHLGRKRLARLAVDLVDAGGVDEHDVAVAVLAPAAHGDLAGLAVQRTRRETALAEQGVQQCRLADADAAVDGDVNLLVFQLVEHALQLAIVLLELVAHGLGHARIRQQLAQALARQLEVSVAVISAVLL